MATSNFGKNNSKFVYAFAMQGDFEETKKDFLENTEEEYVSDDTIYSIMSEDADRDYEYILENIQEEIKKLGFYIIEKHKDRASTYRGVLDIEYYNREYKSLENVQLYVYTEGGYYEGARVDYEVDFDIEILGKTRQKDLEKILKKLDAIFAENTTKLNKIAQFSNGEAMYALA